MTDRARHEPSVIAGVVHRPMAAFDHRAFTLVEMVVAMALLSMIMLAIGSTVVIASFALPSSEDPFTEDNQAQTVLARIASDLSEATYVPERSPTALTLVVHDRDGDGRRERLRYAWSGVAGEPITYQYNDTDPVSLGPPVDQLMFTYDLSVQSEAIPGPAVEDAFETELSRLGGEGGDINSDGNVTVKPDEWHAQLIRPSLAEDATAYRVSRALLRLKRQSPLATGRIGLRRHQPDLTPENPLLSSVTVLAVALPSDFNWYEVGFADAPAIAAGQGVWLSFEKSALGEVAKIQRDKGGRFLATTTDAGSSWSIDYDKGMLHSVYGYVIRQTAPKTVTRRHIDAVSTTLRAAAPGSRSINRRVDLPNRPPVLAGFWESDFGTDPTAIDVNGDGENDWQNDDGSTLLSQLLGGIWQPDAAIEARPLSTFDRLTTVDLWLRATATGGAGPGFRLDADRAASTTATLRVEPSLQADGSQTLRLYHHTGNLTRVLLTEVTDLTPGLLKVRLVVDPQLNTVSLWEHGAFHGTFGYARYTRTSGIVGASCYEGEVAGTIDYVRIAVEE